MNPLMITLTFLSLMSVLTVTTTKHFLADSFANTHYVASRERVKKVEAVQVRAALNDVKIKAKENLKPDLEVPKQPKPPVKKEHIYRSTSLKFDRTRPPNNSRLNFYLLFFAKDPKEMPEECTRYEIAARFLRRLYGACPFFQKIPDAEYRLLSALEEKKEEMHSFLFPDELSSLRLNDENLQTLLITLLKGGQESDGSTYPSLLNFISFDRHKFDKKTKGLQDLTSEMTKINLYFTSPELLYAVFQDQELVDCLVAKREEDWDKILNYEAKRKNNVHTSEVDKVGRKTLKTGLEAYFTQVLKEKNLDPEVYKRLIDFSLGKIGNILFVKSEQRGLTFREKIMTEEITLQQKMLVEGKQI